MPQPKSPFNDDDRAVGGGLRRVLENALGFLTHWLSTLRTRTEDTRHQLKEAFYTTSDQVLEKAEETRKSVKLRMAILEIEHHLNRLYPQIGKITCDLAAQGGKQWHKDADLAAKMELAAEYRQRLDVLRDELTEHQQRSRSHRA